MESASPPSLINAPRGPDSIKRGVCKHSTCCHCSGPTETGIQLQQCYLGPSFTVFIVLCFLHLACSSHRFSAPVHPSLIHPNCGLSPLSSTLIPCFQCQRSEQPVGIPVWGLIYWGRNVLFLNGILGVANLFRAPKGVSGYTQSSWKAPQASGLLPLVTMVKWPILIGTLNHQGPSGFCLLMDHW